MGLDHPFDTTEVKSPFVKLEMNNQRGKNLQGSRTRSNIHLRKKFQDDFYDLILEVPSLWFLCLDLECLD